MRTDNHRSIDCSSTCENIQNSTKGRRPKSGQKVDNSSSKFRRRNSSPKNRRKLVAETRRRNSSKTRRPKIRQKINKNSTKNRRPKSGQKVNKKWTKFVAEFRGLISKNEEPPQTSFKSWEIRRLKSGQTLTKKWTTIRRRCFPDLCQILGRRRVFDEFSGDECSMSFGDEFSTSCRATIIQ